MAKIETLPVDRVDDPKADCDQLREMIFARTRVNPLYSALTRVMNCFARHETSYYAKDIVFLRDDEEKKDFCESLDLVVAQLQEMKARVTSQRKALKIL